MNVANKVSPKYTEAKLAAPTLEDKVDVFEDQQRGWFFDQARRLAPQPDSEFAVLQLTIGYFETYAIHSNGQDSRGKSEAFFMQGFLDVFPPEQFRPAGGGPGDARRFFGELAQILYASGRCGLFHSNTVGPRIWLGRASTAITPSVSKASGQVSVVIIDPVKLLDEVEEHFARYIAKLRDPQNTEARAKFEAGWAVTRPAVEVRLPPGPDSLSVRRTALLAPSPSRTRDPSPSAAARLSSAGPAAARGPPPASRAAPRPGETMGIADLPAECEGGRCRRATPPPLPVDAPSSRSLPGRSALESYRGPGGQGSPPFGSDPSPDSSRRCGAGGAGFRSRRGASGV